MAKFFGKVGFMTTVKTAPGITEESITEKQYYGDIIRVSRRWDPVADKENDDLNISNQISILADSFAYDNLYAIRYVRWLGTNWKVTTVEVEYPRLILSIGGVYNGDDIQDET